MASASAAIAAATAGATEIAPGIRGVGAAGRICGDGAGPQLIDQVCALGLLAQLEIGRLELITQRLHLVGGQMVNDPLGVGVPGVDDIAETALKQTLRFAAAVLILKPGLGDVVVHVVEAGTQGVVNAVETSHQTCIHGVETVTQAALDASDSVVKVLEIEALTEVRTGQSAAGSATAAKASQAAAIAPAKDDGKDNDSPQALVSEETAVAASAATAVLAHGIPQSKVIIRHKIRLLFKYS